MSNVKVTKKTTKPVDDQNLVEMFNQMIGGEGDPKIIKLKRERIQGCFSTVSKILANFADGPFQKAFPEYKHWCDEFKTFSESVAKLIDAKDTKEPVPYSAIKDDNTTKHVILVCKELIIYSHFIVCDKKISPEDQKKWKPSDKWITSHPGLVFEPFAFTKLDVKHIWNSEKITPSIKQYCLATFSVLYAKCHEVYEIVTAPDIDVKKFSIVIVNALQKAQMNPKLSRCKEAFKKIGDSVSMLENNFTDYYKDMVQSQNPNTIIESFIVDVSQGQQMNVRLMQQFRIIISFFKDQSQGKIRDPKIKKLFENLNSRIGILENNAEKKGDSKEPKDDKVDVKK